MPGHGCACEGLGGRCRRARGRPRRSGYRAGGPWSKQIAVGALSVEEVPQRGGGFEAAAREESEWARGEVTADGGYTPLGQGQAVSPPPPSRPHTTTPFPQHISITHTTLAASIHS